MLARSVLPGNTTPANRAPKEYSRPASPSRTASTIALQAMPYVQSPCRIGHGKPAAAANSGSSAAGCGHHPTDRAGPAAAGSVAALRYRARAPAVRPTLTATLAAAPTLSAGEDRSLRAPERTAVEVGHRGLADDHRGLAFIPDFGKPSDGARGAAWAERRRHGHGLAGVEHLAQLDVDARKVRLQAARSHGSWPPRFRGWAAPAACRRSGSAVLAGPSGGRRLPARDSKAARRYCSMSGCGT
jgi:hypothetical protein